MADTTQQEKTRAFQCIQKLHAEPLSRREVVNLLDNYRAARKAISILLDQLQEDADLLLYPPGRVLDSDRVTSTPDLTSQGMAMLARSEDARSYYRSTRFILTESTRILDKLMLGVTLLPPKQKLVVLENMINQKTVEEVADVLDVSPRTVKNYKAQGIERVFDFVNSKN